MPSEIATAVRTGGIALHAGRSGPHCDMNGEATRSGMPQFTRDADRETMLYRRGYPIYQPLELEISSMDTIMVSKKLRSCSC